MTGITQDDIERSKRVRAVTDNLFYWQGKRFIALGLVMMTVGLVNTPRSRAVMIASFVAMLAAIAFSYWLSRSYRAEFGHVSPIPGREAGRWWITLLVLNPPLMGAMTIDRYYSLPIFLTGPVVGGLLLLYRRTTGGGRNHYLLFAAIMSVMAAVPFATGTRGQNAITLAFLIFGAGWATSGWLDDREMRSVLRGA